MTFNEYFATDFCTYNDNGIEAFKKMLESKGFELKRNDWFQCGGHSSIKYNYRTDGKYINFAYENEDRIEVGNYNLG
tara:strand:- start:59 stop:289 length:231 start_codon:yes stop_codon:yes gene_type:complete